MKQTQLLKGVLEGCVLLIISEEEIYGYDMVQKLRNFGFTEMTGGTIYPLLQKLEKNKLISSITRPSPDGPDRKYFQLTKDGQSYTQEFIKQWRNLSSNVEEIIHSKERFLHDK
ncbi:PadR family transcriptional regulator [Jeotgalibaca caeni]|uniref:PadR family transcriptional regulator n=1 Tax=Jeotgalibaca caeni TaxID=3028623 RepID=UPI00237EC433|nr:PadR family transcriptional regulator [Jeotgalibaca caeni]MDE1549204.1 PadR family transcriptional regulator [Jeotgalibaca caeni]